MYGAGAPSLMQVVGREECEVREIDETVVVVIAAVVGPTVVRDSTIEYPSIFKPKCMVVIALTGMSKALQVNKKWTDCPAST